MKCTLLYRDIALCTLLNRVTYAKPAFENFINVKMVSNYSEKQDIIIWNWQKQERGWKMKLQEKKISKHNSNQLLKLFLNHIEFFFFTIQYIDFWTKSLYMVKNIFLKNKTLTKSLKISLMKMLIRDEWWKYTWRINVLAIVSLRVFR